MKNIGLEILDSAASRGDLTALRHKRDGVWREWTFARRDHPHAEGEAQGDRRKIPAVDRADVCVHPTGSGTGGRPTGEAIYFTSIILFVSLNAPDSRR